MKTTISVPGWVLMAVLGLIFGCASTTNQEAAPPPDVPAAPEAQPPSPTSDEEPISNKLKWSTASEVDNFGFDVYRSTAEEGPFDRVTETPMAGAGTVDAPQYYEYVDDDIDPTRDYFYYVESISIDGLRERFSPIIKAPAKRPANAAGEKGSEATP